MNKVATMVKRMLNIRKRISNTELLLAIKKEKTKLHK